jgi:superoxide dismutase, Cu-Zn family
MRHARAMGSVLLVVGVAVVGCKKSEPEPLPAESATPEMAATPSVAPTISENIAAAQLTGPNGVSGVVTFTQDAGGVHVVARVDHAPAGTHGIHLHAGSACEGDFKSAGDHFNPTNVKHGAPDAAEHHAGDFGNIEVAKDGTGNLDISTAMLSIGDGGVNDVLGKAVILHGGKDDMTTQPSGNSGARIACGVVQRAQGQAVVEATPSPAVSVVPQ